MFVSSKNFYVNIVQILIENKFNVNAKDSWGSTALMMSSRYGYVKVVDLLLKNGAVINLKNRDKSTALH